MRLWHVGVGFVTADSTAKDLVPFLLQTHTLRARMACSINACLFPQFQPDALVLACAYGSWNDVANLLRHFGSYTIDACMSPLGLAAIHVAVMRGSVRMVRALLEAGAVLLLGDCYTSLPKNVMFSVTSACARRTGAAARVGRRRRER